MMSWFGSPSTGGKQASYDKFSVKKLEELYTTLARCQELTASNQDILIETTRAIAEVIVYGDQHTELLFDFFCEKNMLPMFLGLLDHPNCSSKLKIQIIQSVSILVQNIRSEISLYYTLSNNHVNHLISHPFNFNNEEVLGQYISFLKTLSLKLNMKTIQFFFNDRLNTFPLYDEAVKFFDHPEAMVRTAVRTVTLNVFKIQDPSMTNFLLYGPSSQYIEDVIRFIHRSSRRLQLLLQRALVIGKTSRPTLASTTATERELKTLILKLEVGLTDQQDHLLYLEDVLSLHVPGLEDVVVDSSIAYFYLPLLIASLLPHTFPFNVTDDLSDKDFLDAGIAKDAVVTSDASMLSLFLLAHSGYAITNPKIVNQLVEAIFLPNLDTTEENDTKTDEGVYNENATKKKDFRSCPLDDEDTDGASSLIAADMLPSEQESLQPNPIRTAFFKKLTSDDERQCLAAACCLDSFIHNESVDTTLLQEAGIAPTTDAYPHRLVNSLLEQLYRDVPICTITQRVLAKLILHLCTGRELAPEHVALLDQVYVASVKRARTQMESDLSKNNPERFIHTFEDEWNSLKEGPLSIESLVTSPYALLPVRCNPAMRNKIPLDMRQPFTIVESTRCVIRSFMIMRLLWTTLHNTSNSQLSSIGVNTVQVNQRIELRNCDFMSVNVLTPSQSDLVVKPALLLLADGCLLLVDPTNGAIAKGTTKSVVPLHRVKFIEGYNDPLVLHIAIRSKTPVGWASKQLMPLVASVTLSESTAVYSTKTPWDTQASSRQNDDTWYLCLRFDNHGSAYWAKEQLQKAIGATIDFKWNKIQKLFV